MASQRPVGSLADAAYRLCGTGRCAATVLCSVKFRTALSTDIPVMRFIMLQGFFSAVGAGAHSKGFAEALIAVVRYNLDFIRKGLACGQFGNGERLAVGIGIFLSQALRNIRIRKRTPVIIDESIPGIGQACTLIGCDRHCQRHRGAVLCVEGTAGVARLAVRIDLCAFDGRWRDSYIVYAGSAILPCAVACFIAISIRQIFIRRNIKFTPFNLFICAAAQTGAAAIVFYGQTHV